MVWILGRRGPHRLEDRISIGLGECVESGAVVCGELSGCLFWSARKGSLVV